MNRPWRVAGALVLALAAALASAGESVVWQIGTGDKSYMEFAIARDYAAYRARFAAKPLVFVVGKSEAGRDWPFIHPGPADAWAGHRVHPFTVRFALADEPRGIFRLRVEFSDVQGMQPPKYAVTVAGRTGHFRLRPGGGDASLADPKAGKPQKIELALAASLLRKGTNEIALACTEGSWVQYDAVTLLNEPQARMPEAAIQSVALKATPFYIRQEGKVRRAVDVAVALTAPAGDLTLRVEAGGERFEVPIEQLPMFGGVSREIGVPDTPKPLAVKVTAVVAGKSKSATLTVQPQRKWRVFVAPSAHTDIGYTDIQPKCAERHNQNLDLAADLLDRFPDFRWNCEVALQAENYLASRKGERLEKFIRLVKEGKVGLQALYCNILTGLCSHEELCRLVYFAHQAHRRYGFPYKSAMINDVPTLVAAMPTMLAGAGIRYFSEGSNNTRAVTFTQLYAKSPCWWEGPDGSRVLMVFVPSYAYASRWGLQTSLEAARERILGVLRSYEARDDYPYDAIFANGAVSDNCPLDPRLATVAKQWNERYAFPKIILCHNAEFFEYIEEKFGDKLPVVRGSGGTYWEDGAGSSARETALCRNAHAAVNNAERLFALGRRLQPKAVYPKDALYAAWRNCMLYDEHTWGAHCSVSQPDSDFTKAQWKIKAQFAHDAARQSAALLAQGAKKIASLVRTRGDTLVVINPMSWPRTDTVEVELPRGYGVEDDNATACDLGGRTLVSVKDVPACGYRVVRLGKGGYRAMPRPVAGSSISSRYYRVTFDDDTGAITSILDRELNKELVEAEAPYGVNQYLYVTGGKGSRIVRGGGPAPKLEVHTPDMATFRRLSLDALGERMIVETSAEMTPRIVTEVTVWHEIKRIDIVNRIVKTKTYEKEAVYFAFPFAAAKPVFRYEAPNAVVNPAKDMLPGACLDWFTVQHFVELDTGEAAIAWATPDAPLVCLQDINRGKWQTKLPITNGRLYAYAMTNYWFTNYLAGQGGEFTFRFAITSRAKADRAASARFGWAASNPLVPVAAKTNLAGTLTKPAASLVEIAEPNVLLIGAKQAETGDALILRLWEIAGKPTTATVKFPLFPVAKATVCNLVEEPQRPAVMEYGAVLVPLRGAGLATLAVE